MKTFREYVNGTETERLLFEREHGGDSLASVNMHEHKRVYDPWDEATADRERNIARQLLAGDEWHRTGGCKRAETWERMSCGTCALLGYEPPEGWGDGYSVKRDGPNYAGWKRVYVQAGRAIPLDWREAFVTLSDNEAYKNAVGRDLVTYGHPGYYGA